MTNQTPPIQQWFNKPPNQRPPLTWVRYGNGQGLVPFHMAKAIQEHNAFCDKKAAFAARCLEAIGFILPVALTILALVLALK